MLTWLKELDRILRGDATRPAALRRGTVEVLEQELAVGILILGAIYGLCMGCYALTSRDEPEVRQLLAATLKVPALFCLSLVVTFPSLYVFNALVGCRLSLLSMVRLLLAALSVLMAVLASLGPIVAFFSVTTTSYGFILLLNVAVFAIGSLLGLAFLIRTLHRLSVLAAEEEREPPPVAAADAGEIPEGIEDAQPAPEPPPSPPRPLPIPVASPHVRLVFYIWVGVFLLVGAQMAWVLRPFVGDAKQPFVVFRHFALGRSESSHFFQGIWRATRSLFTEMEDDHVPQAGARGAPLPGDAGGRRPE